MTSSDYLSKLTLEKLITSTKQRKKWPIQNYCLLKIKHLDIHLKELERQLIHGAH